MSGSIPSSRFFIRKNSFNLIDLNFRGSSVRGQSAIEYLMTYGWMLLVVAVVGGAVFSLVGGQSIDSISGFSGSDVIVEDAGLTSDDNLDVVLRNGAANDIDINKVTVTDGDREAYFLRGESIEVGNQEDITVNGIVNSGGSNSLDIEINYDSEGLTNLQTSGTISGSLDLKAGKPAGLDAPSVGGEWTWVDGSSYFETDSVSEEGFYVMKYETRDDGGAYSKPENQPNTSITFNNAINECQALSNSNYDVSMITNAQWMTVARQIENQGENWVNSEFGSSRYDDKGLVRGWSANDNSDDWENTDFAPNSKRANLYNVGANQGGSSGEELFRRTYILGSGGIIWDFSGNIEEWVDVNGDGTTLGEAEIRSGSSTGFIEDGVDYVSPWDFNDASDYRFEVGSSKDNYGQEQGLGSYSDSISNGRVMRRGGVFNDEYRAGPYAADTTLQDSDPQSATGYRCAAVPT